MKITSKIISSFIKELKKLFEGEIESVFYDTTFRKNNLPNFTMPLIVLKFTPTTDTAALLNGITQLAYEFSISVYCYEPNPELSDDQDYSVEEQDIFDKVRQHFSSKIFLTTGMQDIVENYSFTYTFQDISNAEKIIEEMDNIIGYTFNYKGTCFDNTTISEKLSEVTCLYVKHIL